MGSRPGARQWRVAVVGFDHMHAGDQLRLAVKHPNAEPVGAWDSDPGRMASVVRDLGLDGELMFSDVDQLLDRAAPDIVVICSTTADHVRWVERLAARSVHVVLEKPFAANRSEADRMIHAMRDTGHTLTVNWPLAWYPPHRTTKRLLGAGAVGEVVEIHYHDGNRGPLRHLHDKVVVEGDHDLANKRGSWWYQRASGGGSMLDYLGYGVTLATWFRDGELPTAVTAVTHTPPGLEVDEQSAVIASYARGLSTFRTRWGTFTDPWVIQPAPRCGFVVVGTRGVISSWDYADHVEVRTEQSPGGEAVPVDVLPPSERDHLAFLIDCLENDRPVTGPTSWEISRAGQRIVDTAVASAERRVSLPLLG